MTEEELRDLMGFGGPPQVSFTGRTFAARPEGLAALIRFVRASGAGQGESNAELAAVHHLLEDCITDFPAFAHAAFDTKAGIEEMMKVVRQLVQLYCARNYWPALRLISYIAANLEEFDGDLLRRSGRGLASLSAREACNLALAICLDGRNDEDRQEFYDDLNYEGSPEADALEMVRKMKQARGPAAAEAT